MDDVHFIGLIDAQWGYIRLHFPPQPKVGRKRVNDRQTISGFFIVLSQVVNMEYARPI